MSLTPNPSFRLLAVLAMAACVSLARAAAAAPTATDLLDRASGLYDANRLVEAQRVLLSVDRDGLTDGERERLLNLMAGVDRRLRRADPIQISLDKARLAIREGDLREADRQSNAVRRSDHASPEQRLEASALLDESSRLKAEAAPTIPGLIEQAMLDFSAGRVAQAKAGFDRVYRSGVRLTPEQARTLDRYRDRIVQIEIEQGEPFDLPRISLAAFEADQPETEEQPEEGEDLFQQALKFEAQRRLAEAQQAFDEGRYPTALENYLLVTGQYRDQFTPEELGAAEARIAEIRAILQQQGAGTLQETINRGQLVRDRAIAEFENLLAEARQALGQGQTERARELASEARLRLSEARQVFSEQEYEQRLGQQRALLTEIVSAEEGIRQAEAQERSRVLEQQALEQEARREAEKQRQIDDSLNRIRALQLEQKYEEALQVVEQVLFLDPLNPAGLLLKDTLQDLMIFDDWTRIQRAKSLGFARESNEIQRGLVMPERIMNYPPDWPEISFRRGEPVAFQESPEDRRVLAELRGRRIPANFTDARLEDVLSFFAQVTTLNVDVDWDSLADIGISRDDLVSLSLQPLDAETVLDRVLRKVSPDQFSRANWAVEDGVLVIASDDALRRNTFVVIYDVRDLLFRIQDFEEVPDLGLGEITQGQGGGSQSDFQVEDRDGPTEEETLQRIIDIIQSNIDPTGWSVAGGDTGDVTELNGNLIITNTARNHQAIAGLLSQLREVRSIQVAVDARFLLVNENFFEQIGFDVDVVFNAMNNQFQNALARQDLAPLVGNSGVGTDTLLPSDLVGPFFDNSRVGGSPGFTVDPNTLTNPAGPT
ncbi:MAG: hypothetical protein D6693_09340, partial [Planctomycetota bacterium]